MDLNSITIVIPCYNGWKYMSKCLESLEKQTVHPDRIIIVDDCSTDDSVEQIKDYIKKTELDIILIKNENNVGPGQSRANAIKHIQTQYVSFCDCDDWYEHSFVKDIKELIVKDKPDLIVFDNYIQTDNLKTQAGETNRLIGKDKKEILALYSMSLCRFTTKTDLLKKVYFPALYNGEDGAVAPQIISLSDTIVISPKAYYYYFYRSNSGSMNISERVYKNMIEAFNVVRDRIDNNYVKEVEFIGIKNVLYAASFNAFKADVSNRIIKDFINEFVIEFPEWKHNPYLMYLPFKKRVYLRFVGANILCVPKILAYIHKRKYGQTGF